MKFSLINTEFIVGLLLLKHLMPCQFVHAKGTFLIAPEQMENKIMCPTPQ